MSTLKEFKGVAVTAMLLSLNGCNTHQAPKGPCLSNYCSVTSETPSLTQENTGTYLTEDQKSTLVIERVNQIAQKNIHGSLGGMNPPHYAHTGWLFEGDVLCWNAREDGLEYAIKSEAESSTDYKTRTYKPNWNWSAGFRLDLGYQFSKQDAWDLSAIWTYLHNHASSSVSQPAIGLMFPSFGASGADAGTSILGRSITTASAHWKLKFDVLDIELGRNYFVSKALAVRPFLGVRGAFISQDYDTKYTSYFSETVGSAYASTKMDADINFNGAGIRLGSDMVWHLNCHWGIVGSFSAALLYGPYHTHQTYNGDFVILDQDSDLIGLQPVKVTNRQKSSQFQPNIDTGLGLQWETGFHKERSHFSIAVLYEFSEWFQQNRLLHTAVKGFVTSGEATIISDESSYKNGNGDLGLQGVTVKLRLDF